MQRTKPLEHNPSSAIDWRSAGRFAVRYGIGGVMVAAGIVVLVVVPGEIGATGIGWAIGAGLSLLLLKAGLTVLLLDVLARFSAGGHREREREEEAKRDRGEPGVRPDEQPRERPMTRQRSLGLGVDLAEDERNGGLAAGQPIPRSIPETG